MSKTKLFGVLFGIVTVFQAFGVIHLTPEQLQALQALCGSGVVWGIRDAIGKNGQGI